MADEQAVLDNADILEDEGALVQSDSPPVDGDGNGDVKEITFGKHKFASMDEAGKSYEEVLKDRNIRAEKAALLEKEVAELREKSQLNETLAKLAQTQEQLAKPKDNTPSFDDWVAGIADKAREGDTADAIVELARGLSGMTGRDREELSNAQKSELATVKQQLADLQARQEKATPDYWDNKELVDRFESSGMNTQAAIKLAKEFKALQAPSQPDRLTPPAGVRGTRTTVAEPPQEVYLTKAEEEALMASGTTKEEIAIMKAMDKANRARGGSR